MAEGVGLTARSSLKEAIPAFQGYMRARDFSEHTIRSFTSDLRILGEYLGMERALGDIGTRDLNRFVHWLAEERGVPCTPKSLSRRITTLKVFFGWLAEAGVIPEDPAAPVIHRPVLTGPPRVLTDEEVERVLQVTEAMRRGDPPDARPHLLVTLLLATGIKKGECVNIALDHIDLSDSARPMLWIRYASPRRKHKERRLPLPPDWPTVFEEYRAQYRPEGRLFPWTERNLEYVLDEVAERAGIPDGLSFETLRWTCAVRDYR
ncbi:MAG: hypothetical protein D6793_04240, partial [Thermoflexia bacterium]